MFKRIDLDLQLLGKPRLTVDGQQVNVSPPATFQLLCLIIVSGESGIGRREAAMRLWSHLEPKNALAQLRFNLMKLRDHDALADLLDLGNNHLSVLPQVNVSVDINRNDVPTATDLPNLIQPVAIHWNKEHWQPETDQYASKLASWLETMSGDIAIEYVQSAHLLFPDNYGLATQLVRRLQSVERLTEANEVVIRFEDAWVERFGVADIPSISITAKPDRQVFSESPTEATPQQGTHLESPQCESTLVAELGGKSLLTASKPKLVLALVPVACLLVAVVAVGYTLNRRGGKEKSPKLAVADAKRESGFEIKKIITEGAEPREISPLLGFSGQPMLHYRNQIFEVQQPGQISSIRDTQWIPVDTNGNSKLEVSPDASLLRISTASSQENIRPVADYPYFDAPLIVADGSVVYNRLCGHSFRDHRKLCYWKNGTETLIHISTPEPQNTVVTCKTARGIFGKYSMGKSDGWKYHTFYFDFQSQKTQLLDTPPVIAELGESLLVRPERTDVVNGDYRSHPLDYALLIDKSGRQRRISLASNDDVLGIFGGYIYVCRKKTQFTSDLEFLNFDLEQVNPFPSLPKEVASFGVRTEEIAICVGFDRDRPTRELLLLSKS